MIEEIDQMKVVEKEYHIPAKTYIDKIYIASDGKEFGSKNDCLRYEKQLAIESHPIYTTAIKNVNLFEEECMATLYYLSSKEDYEFFIETQDLNRKYYFNSDFDEYGAGWYIYWCEDGDEHFLKNYDAYESRIESDWEKYKSHMRSRMSKQNKVLRGKL